MQISVTGMQNRRPEQRSWLDFEEIGCHCLHFWPRQFARKWLSFRRNGDEFNHDNDTDAEVDSELEAEEEEENDNEEFEGDDEVSPRASYLSFDEVESIGDTPSRNSSYSLMRGQSETLRQQFVTDQEFRISVGTWNVAGEPPPDDLDLEDWLDASQPADIYVLGFQEIVPLNAGNVLCVEDEAPAVQWESLIRHTLNSKMSLYKEKMQSKSYSAPTSPRHEDKNMDQVPEIENLVERDVGVEVLESSSLASEHNLLGNFRSISKQAQVHVSRSRDVLKQTNHEIPDKTSWSPTMPMSTASEWLAEAAMVDEEFTQEPTLVTPLFRSSGTQSSQSNQSRNHYSCVASKQMVGVFISIWIRSSLRRHVHNLKVSSVGCGLLGYLGNKGAVSVSLSIHQTSFCFVCTHLTSGHNEGDELRRNADVAEILRRTTFPRSVKLSGIELPETIMAHDRIIWLGDLNYRIAASDKETWEAVSEGDWEFLLQKDQRGNGSTTLNFDMLEKYFQQSLKRGNLSLSEAPGVCFEGWHEGGIYFPPTYKFVLNSDRYFGKIAKPGDKRRTPAWCDRILWYGKGLRELSYTCGDSVMSDHRPVTASFIAEVEVVSRRKLKKACSLPNNAEGRVEELVLSPRPIGNTCKGQHSEVDYCSHVGTMLQQHDVCEETPKPVFRSGSDSCMFPKTWSPTEQAGGGCKKAGDRVEGRAAPGIDQAGLLSVF